MESTDIKQEPEELGVSVIKGELSDLEVIKDDLLINIDIPECIEKPTYYCYHCGHCTKLKTNLAQHIYLQHKMKKFRCDRCNYSTNSMIRRKTHLILHTKKKSHVCNECGFRTLHNWSFQKHILKHAEKKLYKCPDCGLHTNHKHTLKYHKMMHQNEKPFQCNLCNFSTRSKHYLKDHKMRHRNNLFQCDACDFSTRTKQNLKAHKITHQNQKPFQCNVCNFRTGCKYYIRKHMLLHEYKKKKSKYSKTPNMEEYSNKVCRICLLKIGEGVKFHYLNRKGLKLQWKLTDSVPQSDLNPVICNPCVNEIIGTGGITLKSLPFINDFNRVKEEPDAEWDMNVTEEVFFNNISNDIKQEPGVERIKEEFGMAVINEEVTRYAEAPKSVKKPTYYCHDCGYGTKIKTYLVQHIFKHHRKKKFQCNQCDYSTVLKHWLQKHLVLHIE